MLPLIKDPLSIVDQIIWQTMQPWYISFSFLRQNGKNKNTYPIPARSDIRLPSAAAEI